MPCNPTQSPYTPYIKIAKFYNRYDLKEYHDSIMELNFISNSSNDPNSVSSTILQIFSLIRDLENNTHFHGEYIPRRDFISIQDDITKILKKWNDNYHEITILIIKLLKADKPQDVLNINNLIELLNIIVKKKKSKRLLTFQKLYGNL